MTLPSGRELTVQAKAVRTGGALPRDLSAALDAGAVEASIEVRALPLADANVVEALLSSMGAIAAPAVPLRCRNCGEDSDVDAAAALPIAPLLRPPGDPELDRPVDRVEWHALPRAIDVGRRGRVDRFRLARRTFADRERLERLLGDDDEAPLPLGAPLVRALGLDALGIARDDDEGEPRVIASSAIAIARALEALPDETFAEAWDAIVRAWDEQHWPPRTLAPVACPRCGARHDLEPVRRPLGWAPSRADVDADAEPFPDLDAFRARAAAITREVLAELGLEDAPGLEVVVDDGVPPCDDGGEPLLGSYTPHLGADGDVRVQSSPFVVALYYRTFRSMYEDEPYDVDAEIRETVEHELEHHANFVEGDDPLDREEREQIAREHARLAGGIDPGTRLAAGASWLASDFARFVRVTWPIWILVLFVLALVIGGGR